MFAHHVLTELSIFDVTLAGGWLYSCNEQCKFYRQAMLQEGMLYTLGERGDVRGHSPSSRTVRDPHNVHASDATGFPPHPHHLQFAGVRLYTLVFGLKQRCLGQLYTLAFGSTHRCWFIDAGIGLYALDAEGCARFQTLLFMTVVLRPCLGS